MSMRQGGPGGRRPRGGRHNNGDNGRGGNGNGGPSGGGMRDNRPRSAASLRHQTFDSNGPDVRVRGNAWQVYEKYQSLARDAQGAGDRILAENYLQHAEHYFRIIEAINDATAAEQTMRGGAPQQPQYGGQPEMPANYYSPQGQLMGGAAPAVMPPGAPQPSMEGMPNPVTVQTPPQAPAEPAQAEVTRRTPPPSPFFASEDSEEQDSGPEQLVARR